MSQHNSFKAIFATFYHHSDNKQSQKTNGPVSRQLTTVTRSFAKSGPASLGTYDHMSKRYFVSFVPPHRQFRGRLLSRTPCTKPVTELSSISIH